MTTGEQNEQNSTANEEISADLQENISFGEVLEANEEPTSDSLATAMAEVAKLKDQMMRDHAETQNIRKRLQRDVENARKFALEKFLSDLLPVVDNLDRAMDIANADEAAKSFVEGLQITRKSFLDVLQKANVVQVNPLGEPFDPQLHEAIATVPNPAMEPNSVMDVMQKGYTLNGRLLRAAMVVVSKAP